MNDSESQYFYLLFYLNLNAILNFMKILNFDWNLKNLIKEDFLH